MPKKMNVRFHELNEIEEISSSDKKQIIELYLKNESLRNITERFDCCSIPTIGKILREKNIKIEKTRIV